MFKFLSGLGYEIQARYNTVLRDIKSKSSSFYDAYLDLQEASIKSIIDAHGIEYDESRTCGYLLRDERIRGLFVNTLGVPKDSYDKIQDRTAKVNRHKHHKEKHVVADSVVLFMEDFHRFMKACCGSNEEFNGEYFRGIFGEYERINIALTQEKESIVSELEELVKEKRMTEDQLRSYQEALAMSQATEEGLAEQNDALLREISALKSLKLSILDQKLNRTIDMLNDLQEYVTESRAVSLAVGYTIVGKERIGPYIDLARSEMGRPQQTSTRKADDVPDKEITEKSGGSIPSEEDRKTQSANESPESEPANLLDVVTAVPPEAPTISDIIGEPAEPYLKSKDTAIALDEKDIPKMRKANKLIFVYSILFLACVVIPLFMPSWMKLLSVCFLPAACLQALRIVQAKKNMRVISETSPWIYQRMEIERDEEGKAFRISRYGGPKGAISKFRTSPLTNIFLVGIPLYGGVLAILFANIFAFGSEIYNWVGLGLIVLIEFVVWIHSSHSAVSVHPRYVYFKTESGSLVCDLENQYQPEGWRKEK